MSCIDKVRIGAECLQIIEHLNFYSHGPIFTNNFAKLTQYFPINIYTLSSVFYIFTHAVSWRLAGRPTPQ